jgi:hypothetical protein
MTISESVRKIIRRIFRITITTVLVLLSMILLILVLIQTGPVQNYGRQKIEAYLEKKLQTKVRIGNLYIDFPAHIILKNIYLEDQRKDTLLYGGKIAVNISMLRLFRNEVRLNELELDGVTLKLKRRLPDSVFNFQFVADAFSSGKTAPNKTDTSGGFQFIVGPVHLHNIHATYLDDATGNDMYLSMGDMNIKLKSFDPARHSYAIPDIAVTDFSGKVRQYKPLLILQQVAEKPVGPGQPARPFRLELGDIDLSRISLDYRDETQNMDAAIHLRNLHTKADSLDFATGYFKIKQITLDKTEVLLHFGKTALVKTKKETAQKDTVTINGNWSLDIARLTINSSRFQYKDDNQGAVKNGMDYNHLDLDHLQVNTSDVHADPTTYRAVVAGLSFHEKSGFVLKDLSAQVLYDATGASLKNLVLQTKYSEVKSQASIRYRSLDDLKKHLGDMETNLEFDRSRIAVKDILIFVPSLEGPLKENPNAVLRLNGKLSGQLKDLHIPYIEMEGVGNTTLEGSGRIRGLPDANKAYFDLVVTNLKTSKADIYRFAPVNTLPENIRIPENISARGKFRGTLKNFFVQLHAATSEGDADINGSLDLDRKTYDLTADGRSVDLGYILKQDSLIGKFTLSATAKGSGFDPKKMNTVFHVNVAEARFKSYTYHGLIIDARLENGKGNLVSSIQDPHITYRLQAETDLQEKYPSLKLKLQLDTLDLLALNWMGDSLQLHLNMDADFRSTDPDALQGRLHVGDLGWTLGSHAYHTDSISFLANHTDTAQIIQLRSEAADVDWSGRYKLTQVPESFRQFINHYYQVTVSKPDSTEPEHWKMSLVLRPSPLVFELMPSLKGSDSLRGALEFNSSKRDFNMNLQAGKIQLNQQVIHRFNFLAGTKETGINYDISVADAGHPGFQLYRTALYGRLADNKLSATLRLQDNKEKSRYVVSAGLTRETPGFRLVLNPDSLLLNYQKWLLPADNFIHYDSAGLIVHNMKLENQSESVFVNSPGETSQSPLDIRFTHFKIKTITQFAEQDSLLLDGTINGKAEIKNLFTEPLFTSDIKIDNLSYEKDTLGNLLIQVNNSTLNTYIAHIVLEGHENDVQIDGKYLSGESKMDMNVMINRLNLASFKGLAFSQVRNMSGYINGNLNASGNLDRPVLNGSLHFDHAVLTPVITGEPLTISGDTISFDEEGFNFNHFSMLDSAGNEATLDGNVFTKDFRNYGFDLSLNAQNFRIVNAPKEPNRLFYGKLNINAELNLTGDLNLPKLDLGLRVNKNTDFYLILPSEDPEVVDRNGVIVFVSKTISADSLQLKNLFDSLATTGRFKGMDVSTTIETDSSARFTLIIDERNGDALSMRGRAELSGGIDKSGKVSLTGNYLLDNGSYNISLSVLHRKFDIQPGSVVTWTGDPTKANINIRAIYTVSTAPIDLMGRQLAGRSQEELNRYNQRIPFLVKLNMTGELLKPVIHFDIALPDNLIAVWPDVETKLMQIRSDEAEINKQVFALLLLGQFVQENPFQSAASSISASTMAKQSASKILGEQLNQFAGSLIKGVDINVDMNSRQDYSSGAAISQTEMKVNVSKNLFNERVRVSVGSGFQLEQVNPGQSTTAGDYSVDYRLSKDGRYMIRVFRKDQYDTVIQGEVVQTGLSFILTLDYDQFRELFQHKKEEPVPVKTSQQSKTPSENNPPVK